MPKTVADGYRSDLSGYTSEQKVAEFACELALCASLSRIATSAKLRPPIPGQQKHPDLKAEISGHEIFAEVKRFSDKGPGASGRSITLREQPPEHPTAHPAKPRMMALLGKLRDVPEQLPDRSINIVFVFHPGFGESQRYIQQALFGDKAFWDELGTSTIGDNALFAEDAWRKVSAVAYVRVDGVLRCHALWQNPAACVELPASVQSVITTLS